MESQGGFLFNEMEDLYTGMSVLGVRIGLVCRGVRACLILLFRPT